LPNLLADPGFELNTGWTYGGLSQRSSDEAYAGSWSALLRERKGDAIEPDGSSTRTAENIAVVAGREYYIRFRWFGATFEDPNTPITLSMNHRLGAGFVEVDTWSTPIGNHDTWQPRNYVFTALGTSIDFRFTTDTTQSVINYVYHLDGFVLDDRLAVQDIEHFDERGLTRLVHAAALPDDPTTNARATFTYYADDFDNLQTVTTTVAGNTGGSYATTFTWDADNVSSRTAWS
jgi:hypothetical protein